MIRDRTDAGRRLAEILSGMNLRRPVVLAVPRGGVVVGAEIARALGCALDVVMSKKITPPGEPEYAIGAVTGDGTVYRSGGWDRFGDHPRMGEEIEGKKAEIARRVRSYRGSMEYDLEGRDVILCDDGIATGSTVMAILRWLPERRPRRVILAVPVMPRDAVGRIRASRVVVLETPSVFHSVGQFYGEFEQVDDSRVIDILRAHGR